MAQIHCLRAQLDEQHNCENRIDQLIDECKREFTKLSEDHEACQSYPFFLLCILAGIFIFLNLVYVGTNNVQGSEINRRL